MRIRILKRLSAEELLKHIKKLESTYGMGFDELEKRFMTGELEPGLYEAYTEWATLIAAYRGYQENGELEYVAEETLNLADEAFERLLTPKRLELLSALASRRVQSINELARRLKRDVKNVYYDLKALEGFGLIRFRRSDDRSLVPEPVAYELSILLR